MTVDALLEENRRRLERQALPYDPLTGEGSPVERFPLPVDDTSALLLPLPMREHPWVAERLRRPGGPLSPDALRRVRLLRVAYDFEYWCALCVKIQDKTTKRMVPFVLRAPQLKLLKVMLEDLWAGRPVRVILLKARQWGGSTLVQLFMAWIQCFHRRGWHSVIVADVEDQARNIKAMYSRMARHHPAEVLPLSFSNFEGSSKNKVIAGRDCVVYLGSMQKPDALRSADVMMAHLSEVGLWKETDGRKPEDLVQSIAGTVPLEPFSVIVMESTAKGVGNFFHREWVKARNGESGYRPVFVAWYEIAMYSLPFASETDRRAFAASLTERERYCFELGATLEAIQWYRMKKHTESYDDWRMGCEFPTTPEEAFQSTGRRAHPPRYVSQMRRYTRPPKYRGDLFADAVSGRKAIDGSLRFAETPGGDLWLWALPEEEPRMTNRYVVSMDIGGRSDGADWSVLSVIDRYWLAEGGVEECIGTCRFHLDQDLAVWKAVQLARYFHNALLVVEANSLNAKGTEGDHTLTILDEIRNVYDHLYCRSDPQKIREGAPLRYGFFTSAASKTDLVNQMNKRFREIGHIERDARALDEADCYEVREDGSYGAVAGEHDDIYMSRAIGLKASSQLPPPRPVVVPPSRPKRRVSAGPVRRESSF